MIITMQQRQSMTRMLLYGLLLAFVHLLGNATGFVLSGEIGCASVPPQQQTLLFPQPVRKTWCRRQQQRGGVVSLHSERIYDNERGWRRPSFRAPQATTRTLPVSLPPSPRDWTLPSFTWPLLHWPSLAYVMSRATSPDLWSKLMHPITDMASFGTSLLASCWYCLPMLLCLVPVLGVLQSHPAVTPSWWKMVDMAYIRQSSDAVMVIATFLLSNVAYFAAGLYLLARFPPLPVTVGPGPFRIAGRRKWALRLPRLQIGVPSRYTWLAIWVLCSGAMSTLFHTVQALGDHALAEALCYLDHGFAISTVAYFAHVCGKPNTRTWAVGLAGLLALALPLRPGYAWLHASWHLISAATGLLWVHQDDHVRRRAALVRVMVQHRNIQEEAAWHESMASA